MERLRGAVAHNVDSIPRTDDAALCENITFSSMLLNQNTMDGLHHAGFVRPSPIQRCAIPVGRCGTDLIIQAKSGTGKTLVFGIIALEMIDVLITQPQVLILAPTREIAVQIKEVLSSISVKFPNLKIGAFIGGLSVTDDQLTAEGCQIAVGTPGRVKQLVIDGILSTRAVRLFVLDEADRMVDKTFLKDVCFLFSKLPERKQCLVSSATYPEKMEKLLKKFLVNPQRINPSTDTFLLGLRQYVAAVKSHTSALVRIRNKTNKLLEILSTLTFRQCLIFCNIQSRMESICKDLAGRGWPALHLSGSMPQKERLAAIAALQNQRCRILLTTDLAARGVDAEQVDLVLNLDLPYDTETYLHRIGRAGRFGAPGIAITIVDDPELKKFREMLFEAGGSDFQIPILNEEITADVWSNSAELECIGTLAKEESPSASDEEEGEEVEEEEEEEEEENEELIALESHLIKLPKFEPTPFCKILEDFKNPQQKTTEFNEISNNFDSLKIDQETSLDEKDNTLSSNETELAEKSATESENDFLDELADDTNHNSTNEENSPLYRNQPLNITQYLHYQDMMCRYAAKNIIN